MALFHTPVMVREVIASLRCRAGAIYVDGTVGGGGHAEAILLSTAPDGLLIGIDADGEALREAEKRLAPFGKRKILVKGNFADMDAILAERNIEKVDGILLDLGVSSHQLDTAERGFSFSMDAPLDMRMDRSRGTSAYDLIHTLSGEELERIIRDYGEERRARRIARSIVESRNHSPLRTTADLADLVVRAFPHEAGTPEDPPGDPDLPGPSDRRQRRTRQPSPGDGQRDETAQAGGAFLGDLISFTGRPDCQKCLPCRGKRLYLSPRSSRMRLRPEADLEGPDQKTGHARRNGDS